MNDTTIIKAELCDFLSARTKNLANIQNMEDREVYISMVVDASNQIENLTSLFSQFEKVDEILGFNHMVVSNNNFVGETNKNVNATGTISDEVVSETVNGGPTEVAVDNTPVEVQTSSEKSVPDTAEKDAVEEEKVVIPLKKEESTGTGEKADTVSEAKDEVKTEIPVVETKEETKPEPTVALGSEVSSGTAAVSTDKVSDIKIPPVDLVIPIGKAIDDTKVSTEESTGDKKDIVETASVDSNNIDVKTTPLPFINITTTQSNDSGKVDDTSNNMNNAATIPTTNPFISSSEESSSNDVIPQAPLATDVPLQNKPLEEIAPSENNNAFSEIFKNANKGVEENVPNEVSFGVVNNSPATNDNIKVSMRILKMKPDRVKAILVSQKQIAKLKASKDLQKSALDFGISEGMHTSNNTPNVSVQAQIESLMAQASALYKEGKMQEAQDLYAKISELNKNSN
ncbi:MAG: hypothetical protein MR846_03245 [Tenericutes bacterium]|nr:hypothetical protein [Mycoplasmatota bacterium]